jgi:hypothetical protein
MTPSEIPCRSLDARHAERTDTTCAITAENAGTAAIAAQTLTQPLRLAVDLKKTLPDSKLLGRLVIENYLLKFPTIRLD